MRNRLITAVFLIVATSFAYAQNGVSQKEDHINFTDSQGNKQGTWKKTYANGKTAYEGTFKNNKPVGEFRRYFESGNISALLKYNQTGDYAKARLFYETGKTAAEGNYSGKLKDSTWNYYADDGHLAMIENFQCGKKNGKFIKYWDNGNVAEETNWINDIQTGMWRKFYESGKTEMETKLESGIRVGLFYYYYENGIVEIKGSYSNDQKDGDWCFYERSGKLKNQVNYIKGKATNQDELDKIETKELKKMDQNRTKLVDPEKYMNNGQEFIRMQDNDNSGE